MLLVLERFGGLAGRVQTDNPKPRPGLLLSSPGGAIRSVYASSDSEGTFEARRMRPGEYSVQAYIDSDRVHGARVEGVVVHPGAVTRDPRLDPLDLRGRMRTITVTVFETQGGHASGARVGAQLPGRADLTWHDVRSGRASLRLVAPAIDLEVRARGLRTAHLLGVSEDVTVTLGEPLRFEAWVEGVHPIEGGHRLALCLRREADSPQSRPRFEGMISGGRLAVELSDSGMHLATWRVHAPDAGGPWVDVDFPPQPIDVADPPRDATLTAPSPEAVAAAVARLNEAKEEAR